MSPQDNATLVLNVLHLVEQGDVKGVAAAYHPDVEFHWPPGLPYSGVSRGRDVGVMNARFIATWGPLRPTPEVRRLNPRVVAVSDDGHVVVHYVWRAMDRNGHRFETETLADYELRDGRLFRAQMYHFDLSGLQDFLWSNGGVAARSMT
jgi:ketosteroid isomerase-like protein